MNNTEIRYNPPRTGAYCIYGNSDEPVKDEEGYRKFLQGLAFDLWWNIDFMPTARKNGHTDGDEFCQKVLRQLKNY